MNEQNKTASNNEPIEVSYQDKLLADAKDFLEHMLSYVQNIPEGGYNDKDMTEVKITVGKKTLVAYDHAALVQSLIEAVDYYIDEIE